MFTLKPLADGQLAATKGTLYTCPTGFRTKVNLIRIYNSDSSARLCRIYVKPGSTSRVIFYQTVPANEFIVVSDMSTPIYLDDGDLLEGDAAAGNVVDYYIDGEEEQKGI